MCVGAEEYHEDLMILSLGQDLRLEPPEYEARLLYKYSAHCTAQLLCVGVLVVTARGIKLVLSTWIPKI
jgi:hypothetical protein